MDSDELSESGGVVVPRSLGIAVGLQDGVGGHDLVLEGDLLGVLLGAGPSGHHRQVGDHLLCVLRLSSSGFSSDEHRVVLFVLEHVPVRTLRNGPQMGGSLIAPFAKIDLANPVGVDGVTLIRVHHLVRRKLQYLP